MKLCVQIPTHRRPDAINRCLVHLAAQQCASSFEIIVGLDGPAEATPDPIVPDSIKATTRLLRLDRLGLIGVRKAMLETAQAEIILWLNDDSDAQPGLLDAHLAMHKAHAPCVVAGASRFQPIEHPDLFDLLVQHSDLVFFQSNASNTEPIKTDYRNCFGLNMSFDRSLANQVGAIPPMPESYGYDDIELAYRLTQAGAQIWHTPNALVLHDHRYRPIDVHRREYLLGRAAWHYAQLNPAFANDLFGRDIRSPKEIAYLREALIHEQRDALRIERSFIALPDQSLDLVDPSQSPLLAHLAEHWVILKRYLWRQGLLDGVDGVEPRWSLLQDRAESPIER